VITKQVVVDAMPALGIAASKSDPTTV